ncbi:MAG: GTPase HflX [Planctomycetota bacterium]
MKRRKERVILLGLVVPGSEADREQPLAELRLLAETAGAAVVGAVWQKAARFNASTYVGSGKAEEVRSLIASADADTVICDHDLTPAQIRNLEAVVNTKVIDRSDLILDIFASHARTKQAKLQVELAQLEYAYPRLAGMWKHFERLEGAIGTRGPGETQLETDRRLVRKHADKLKRDLRGIQKRVEREADARQGLFSVALVGYTNAGKSTLMNALTGAGVLVEDKLFATLDTRSARWEVAPHRFAILSDTVGFIRRLPHHLVASFHATLEGAMRADLLLHVADASHPYCEEQIQSVDKVLADIGCAGRPRLTVLNKADVATDEGKLLMLKDRCPGHVLISALRGDGLGEIRERVAERMSERFVEVRLTAGLGDGKLIAFMRGHTHVLDEAEHDGGLRFAALVDRQLLGQLNAMAGSVELKS